jgi:hypothetical protein
MVAQACGGDHLLVAAPVATEVGMDWAKRNASSGSTDAFTDTRRAKLSPW